MNRQPNKANILKISVVVLLIICACNMPMPGGDGNAQPILLSGPAVAIQEPLPGAQVEKGDSFIFFATANDDAGIIRLDLWIDDTLVLSQASPDANGMTPLSLSYPLVAVKTGTYALIARAHNSQGGFGESVVHYVTVYETSTASQELAQYIVQDGDTLESIAAKLGVSVQSIQQANPHITSGQVKPGQVILIPMQPRQPAQAAVPGPGGAQPIGQQGGQQQGVQQQAGQNPANPSTQIAIKRASVNPSPVYYGQGCTTEPTVINVTANIEPLADVSKVTLTYSYISQAGAKIKDIAAPMQLAGGEYKADVNIGKDAEAHLAQAGGKLDLRIEALDTSGKLSYSPIYSVTVNFCTTQKPPPANLPGVLPQFLPGGQGVGQLDPSLFPDPKTVLNPPKGEVTAPSDVKIYTTPKDCAIRLTWTDAQNETSYQVDRYEFGKPNPKTIASLKADMTIADDTLPQPGKYGYRVLAIQEFAGKKMIIPSALAWADLLASDKCKPLPEFKRIYFQPVYFEPDDLALDWGFFEVTVADLPAFRTPRGQQTNYHIGSWDESWLGYSAPAPKSVYSNPGASLYLEVQANASDDPKTRPPVDLGQFGAYHPFADLTASNGKEQVWLGDGKAFKLSYRLWLEDWLWNGTASDPTLPAPTNVKLDSGQGKRGLTWDYDETAQRNLIDGFIVYPQYICPGGDVKIQYPLVLGKTPHQANIVPENEPIGCKCAYQVSAFGSDGESALSSPQQEECATTQPVDGVQVTFVSLQIDPKLISGNATGAEIHLFANEFKRSSNALVVRKGVSLLLNEINFNGKTDNNGMLVSLGAGKSLTLKLNFSVPNLCQGSGVFINKQGNSWVRTDGKNYVITSTDGYCKMVVALQDSSAWPGAPSAASLKPVGGTCRNSTECNSGKCTSGLCAPNTKGAANVFCFANSHCQSGVCECTVDGKSVPCPPIPPANISGFCADGKSNGNLCSQNEQCASGYCANGVCAPPNGLGQRGDYCHNDNQCANGFCACPGGWDIFGSCKSGKNGTNNWGSCGPWVGYPDGNACNANDDCMSRQCVQNKCTPRDYTGLSGEYCHHDNHCFSKVCQCQKVMGGGFCIGYQDFTPTNHATCAP